jgi:hypothetical protein
MGQQWNGTTTGCRIWIRMMCMIGPYNFILGIILSYLFIYYLFVNYHLFIIGVPVSPPSHICLINYYI